MVYHTFKGEIMDRRVKKTQAAIRKAFTELIREKGDVNAITIKEIVDRADISRSTFYTHYSDIFELTEDISNMFADDIASIVIETHKSMSGADSYRKVYEGVLTYLYDQGPLAKTILVDMRNTHIINRISDSIRDSIGVYYKTRYKIRDEDLTRGTATFWTNGVLGIMRDWANYDFNYSVSEMSEIIAKSIETCAAFFSEN